MADSAKLRKVATETDERIWRRIVETVGSEKFDYDVYAKPVTRKFVLVMANENGDVYKLFVAGTDEGRDEIASFTKNDAEIDRSGFESFAETGILSEFLEDLSAKSAVRDEEEEKGIGDVLRTFAYVVDVAPEKRISPPEALRRFAEKVGKGRTYAAGRVLGYVSYLALPAFGPLSFVGLYLLSIFLKSGGVEDESPVKIPKALKNAENLANAFLESVKTAVVEKWF